MKHKKEKEIHLGDVNDANGELNRQMICTVTDWCGDATYYYLWITRDFCDWMLCNASDGHALAIGLAITMRLTWGEICQLKFSDILLHKSGVGIVTFTFREGRRCTSHRDVSLGLLPLTWVLARVVHLYERGFTLEAILECPVAGDANPQSLILPDELAAYAKDVLDRMGREYMENHYGIIAEKGAVGNDKNDNYQA